MSTIFSQRASAPDNVLVREVDGESVLLNLERGTYYGLDEVGTAMWAQLTQAASVEAAYQALLAAYDVDAERLRQDLADLLEQLVENGLLELEDGPA